MPLCPSCIGMSSPHAAFCNIERTNRLLFSSGSIRVDFVSGSTKWGEPKQPVDWLQPTICKNVPSFRCCVDFFSPVFPFGLTHNPP